MVYDLNEVPGFKEFVENKEGRKEKAETLNLKYHVWNNDDGSHYYIIKYNKEWLNMNPKNGLLRSIILNEDNELISFAPPKSLNQYEYTDDSDIRVEEYKRYKTSFFALTDRIAPGACIGLFFGRLANFINGELYGRTSDAPWAMVFPSGGEMPRHPSQLYEAALEGLVLFFILHAVFKKRWRKMEVSGLFLIGYGCSRSIVEFFREPDEHLADGIHQFITMGQILSIPMILLGFYLLWRSQKHA